MAKVEHPERKTKYFEKLKELLDTYSVILIVHADHVGSKQLAEIRMTLRGKASILMGKNTMIRANLKGTASTNIDYKTLIPKIKDNIGLIFCGEPPAEVRKLVLNNKVPAPARQGAIAPVDVKISAGPTSLDPSQTSFFQALGISTKLVKGQIEIQADVNLIKKGDKVTASQSALLKKLNIMPFNYGLVVKEVWDKGVSYDAAILDITNEDLLEKFMQGIQNVAAFSREINLPNQASIVHTVLEAFKATVALGLELDFSFPEIKPFKDRIDNPDLYQSAAPTQAASGGAVAETVTKEEEPEEDEEEDDMGFNLFDD